MMLLKIAEQVAAAPAAAAEAADEAVPEAVPEAADVELPPIEIEPLHPKFGARLGNVDISAIESWPASRWDEIEAAFNEYGVLVLSAQGDDLDPKALSAFAGRFHRSDPTEIGLPEEIGPLVRRPHARTTT